MPINIYDTIVVGAGVAGCNAAFALKEKGQRVLLLDRSAVPASGGSGAAGAFISPKIGKGGKLQELTNQAYLYAVEFYLKHFPEHYSQSGIVRVPRDQDDKDKYPQYEKYNIDKYQIVDKEFFNKYKVKNEEIGFWFKDAGVCDAPGMCHAIWERVEFRQLNVSNIEMASNGIWNLSDGNIKLSGKNIVLSTGYQNELFDMRYMGVKGLWGSRGDYFSGLDLEISIHKRISISKNINGIIKLGATHVKSKEPCIRCNGKPLETIEAQASKIVDTGDFVLKETFCGMRSGSRDFFPLVGKVIDVEWMLEHHPNIVKGAKPPLKYHKNLYILNGVGGRGFVFSPLMAKWLSELIVDRRGIDSRVDPDRLFLKWARRLNRGR